MKSRAQSARRCSWRGDDEAARPGLAPRAYGGHCAGVSGCWFVGVWFVGVWFVGV